MNELQILSMRDELEKIASPLVVPTIAHSAVGALAVPYSGVTSMLGSAHSMSRGERKKLTTKQRKRPALGSVAGGLAGSALAYKGSGKLIKRHVKNIDKAVEREYAPLLREAEKRHAKDLDIVLPKQTFDVKKLVDPSYKIDAPKTTKAIVRGSSKLPHNIRKGMLNTKLSRKYDWLVEPTSHAFSGAGSKAKI